MNKTEIIKPVDLEYTSMVAALDAAQLYTSMGFEVTKPLKVAGMFCIRVEQ